MENVCSILHCKYLYFCIYDFSHILLPLWHPNGFMECVCVGMSTNTLCNIFLSVDITGCLFFLYSNLHNVNTNYINNPYIIVCLSANITENCIISKTHLLFYCVFKKTERALIQEPILLFMPWLFWKSICHSTYALYDTPFITDINSYMFRHRGAILRKTFITKVYKQNANVSYNQYIIQLLHSMIHHLWHTSTPTCFA